MAALICLRSSASDFGTSKVLEVLRRDARSGTFICIGGLATTTSNAVSGLDCPNSSSKYFDENSIADFWLIVERSLLISGHDNETAREFDELARV